MGHQVGDRSHPATGNPDLTAQSDHSIERTPFYIIGSNEYLTDTQLLNPSDQRIGMPQKQAPFYRYPGFFRVIIHEPASPVLRKVSA